MKIGIILVLMLIKNSQLQETNILFNCTFDDGLVDDCIFNGLLPFNDQLEIYFGYNITIDIQEPPDRPLSDATSVCMFKRIFE